MVFSPGTKADGSVLNSGCGEAAGEAGAWAAGVGCGSVRGPEEARQRRRRSAGPRRRARSEGSQRGTVARGRLDHQAAARAEPDVGRIGGDLNQDDRSSRPDRRADRCPLAAMRQAADQGADTRSSGDFGDIPGAAAHHPSLFVYVGLTLRVHGGLELRIDRYGRTAMPERVKTEGERRLAAQLRARLRFRDLAFHDIALQLRGRHHPPGDQVAFAAGIGTDLIHQLDLNLYGLSLDEACKHERGGEPRVTKPRQSLPPIFAASESRSPRLYHK